MKCAIKVLKLIRYRYILDTFRGTHVCSKNVSIVIVSTHFYEDHYTFHCHRTRRVRHSLCTFGSRSHCSLASVGTEFRDFHPPSPKSEGDEWVVPFGTSGIWGWHNEWSEVRKEMDGT
jgi:hypothetical protein